MTIVYRSIRGSVCLKLTPISAVASQNVTNKTFIVCFESEIYPVFVTLRPLGSMRQGEAELCTLQY